MNLHDCPIPECKAKLRPRKLMCPKHWRMVSQDLQSAVWRTWQGGTLKIYLAARRAAIGSVCKLLGFSVCRECGCSERDACLGGCGWVKPDLCSTCANNPAFAALDAFQSAAKKAGVI